MVLAGDFERRLTLPVFDARIRSALEQQLHAFRRIVFGANVQRRVAFRRLLIQADAEKENSVTNAAHVCEQRKHHRTPFSPVLNEEVDQMKRGAILVLYGHVQTRFFLILKLSNVNIILIIHEQICSSWFSRLQPLHSRLQSLRAAFEGDGKRKWNVFGC